MRKRVPTAMFFLCLSTRRASEVFSPLHATGMIEAVRECECRGWELPWWYVTWLCRGL